MNRFAFWLETSGKKLIEVAAHVGKTENTIKNWRDGESQPLLSDGLKLAEITGIDAANLFEEVDAEGNTIPSETVTA